MNPNIPYGQQMPMQPPLRRHEAPYGQIPPHMRPHPGNYQQFYPQPMGPMMPQYPQYQQQWYPYQPQMHPHHASRSHYYQQGLPPGPPPPMPQMHGYHHGPVIVSSQPHPHSSPRHVPAMSTAYPPQPPSTTSTTSIPHIQTPPSRPISTTSAAHQQKESTPSVTSPAAVVRPVQNVIVEPHIPREPFFPPLPWLSVRDQTFPPRAPRRRRRIARSAAATFPPVEMPSDTAAEVPAITAQEDSEEKTSIPTPVATPTPLHSDTISETTSTQPTTPSSTIQSGQEKMQTTPTQTRSARATIPVLPVIPVLPQSPSTTRAHRDSSVSTASKVEAPVPVVAVEDVAAIIESGQEIQPEVAAAPLPPPSSWAALLRSNLAANGPAKPSTSIGNGLGLPKTESLGDVLRDTNVTEIPSKVAFLQPRGLVNTGNMCYMNSVLQMLVFCIPFYEFLDKVAKRAPHTFKSDTPLIDAMIMFMREYPAIDSTTSVEQLRLRLKPEDYEQYGDSFIPEYVYNVIKELPRFRDMRRGHQQDAQEFLGFLLEELHEECAHAMRAGTSTNSGTSTPVGSTSNMSEVMDNDNGWMEVGHKQKSAVTRSSGSVAMESPVTGIFGGKLRSEFKVPGDKLSITSEPYQALQLDIGSLQVNNIVDALKGLTKPESMQGDFQSSRGLKATATKQVFIETLPPVLILHLKRFHYDSTTKRVEKIWKKIGYPLELEIPREIFPTSARNKFAAHGGVPKYRLIGVIYHHGKNANGGHYTVDIRRQDEREWIRLDDTLIRRVRSDDVAEGGSEEDPKVLAAALERHNQAAKSTNNRFEQIEGEEEPEHDSDKNWSQVNGHSRTKSIVNPTTLNGTSTPGTGRQTPRDRFSVKDNKVAYLLFYQRIAA